MSNRHGYHGASLGKNSVIDYAALIVLAAGILLSALRTPSYGADQVISLSVQSEHVIRLAQEPECGRVYDVAFSPGREPLTCAFALNKVVQVWDVSAKPRRITALTPTAPMKAEWPIEMDKPHAIAFSTDGARLAMGYFGVQIWDVDRRKILFAIPLLWDVEAVRFSAMDSNLIIACSWREFFNGSGEVPGMIEVFQKVDYERMPVSDPKNLRLDMDEAFRVRTRTDPHERRDICCLAVSPDGKRFFAGGGPVFNDIDSSFSKESSVTVWDIPTKRRIYTIGDKEALTLRFCLSPDGRCLYSCGNKVLGWGTEKPGPPTRRFDASERRMISIAVSPDGNMLAAGSPEGTVVIWHVDSATQLARLTHQGGPVYGLAFSPTSRKLVAAGERGMATVWDIRFIRK
jgi:WD40 repeat protein